MAAALMRGTAVVALATLMMVLSSSTSMSPILMAAAHEEEASSTATPTQPSAGGAKPSVLTTANLREMAPEAYDQYMKLAPEAKAHASAKLDRLRLPAHDGQSLKFAHTGEMYIVDKFPVPEPVSQDEAHERGRRFISDRPPTAYDANGLPIYHSRPGMRNTIVLDFDGHVVTDSESAWGAFDALPFDPSNDGITFSAYEQSLIALIWARVAEDYAPFLVDVTTEPVTVQNRTILHMLITSATQRSGNPMPESDGGGVAFVDIFDSDNTVYYSPALVFYDHLDDGHNAYVADAGSHEIGHNLGLGHDGYFDQEYSDGFAGSTTENSWGPIMGAPYDRAISQWSNGQYSGATNIQDDVAIITDQFGSVADEAGDTAATAAQVTVNTSQAAVAGDSVGFTASGVIATRTDADWWAVVLDANGGIIVTAVPWYASQDNPGNNLDIKLTLYDTDGTTVLASSNPSGTSTAQIDRGALPAGTYFLAVEGAGDPAVFTSDYGSIGQYELDGIIANAADAAAITSTVATTTPVTFACTPDGYEPNNDATKATPLTLAQGSGNASLTYSTEVGGTVCRGDVDFFTLDVCAGGVLNVSVLFTHSVGDIDAALFSGHSLDAIDFAASANDQEDLSFANPYATNLSVSVSVFGYDGAVAPYTLRVLLDCNATANGASGNCMPDAFEPNDDLSAATELDIVGGMSGVISASVCSRDVDAYSVDVCAHGTITASILFDGSQADLDMVLLDASGDTVDTSESTGDRERVQTTDTTGVASVHYVVVYPYSPLDVGAYQLRVDVACPGDNTTMMSCANDLDEPNDTPDTATSVTTVGGVANFNATLCGGSDSDVDVYAVDMCAGAGGRGSVLVKVRFDMYDQQSGSLIDVTGGSNSNATVNVTLIDGGRRATGSMLTPNVVYILYDSPSVGERVYVSVSGAGSAVTGNTTITYSMQVVLNCSATCGADDYEYNDTPETAAPIPVGVTSISAHVCGPVNERDAMDDQDFYLLPACGTGLITVKVLFDHDTAGDLDIVLFSPNGDVAASSDSTTDNERVRVYADAATDGGGGRYMLLVHGYDLSVGARVPYTINLELLCSGLGGSTTTAATTTTTTKATSAAAAATPALAVVNSAVGGGVLAMMTAVVAFHMGIVV
ncbi:hypothetical protein PTSG_10336 [Salpingoeca rosetta]|uniref:Uncharacterized protein n=1 Tax=Salpingoeca rosetta (strain ATCC 50818 / BSB-021) TaxID=946362 RepID=F2UR06_SALR5|nr:uncharacterized protein PTSG_10336 [Salpingoeca rosetta]EGD80061.1 hypothetical protein PTSG_10336 [Salpingoeca rosetta]|eukprot:XP_004988386.1 hypothetical protein PTSG_10336 [Salpingoeca rosetta]